MREACCWKLERRVPSLGGKAIDRGTAGIAKPQELCHLIVRLPRGIVARPTYQLVHARGRHVIEACVAAGNDEHGSRKRQLAVRKDERFDVTGEMVHRYDGKASSPAEGLGKGDAHEQRAHESGPLRHRHAADLAHAEASVAEGGFHHAADVPHVLPRCQLRDDASPTAMNGGL
jgi:hypothetical protein